MRWAVTIMVMFMLLLAQSVQAAVPPSTSVHLQHQINEDGSGRLIANPAPYGQGAITWESCSPMQSCVPIAARAGEDWRLDVGAAAPGTVFVASSVQGSQTVSATSLLYRGPARPASTPRVSGELRTGALVQPVTAEWSGGWGIETSSFQLQICATADGSGCFVVADTRYWNKCPGTGAVLFPAYTGSYLRVLEQRFTTETPFPAILLLPPLPPFKPGPTIAVGSFGPIAAANGPLQADCGLLPPRVRLLRHPRRLNGQLRLGRVVCLHPCDVLVAVRQAGGRGARLRGKLGADVARQTLALPARLARRLKSGKATVRVNITGLRRSAVTRVNLPKR